MTFLKPNLLFFETHSAWSQTMFNQKHLFPELPQKPRYH